jgi:hypothetical protein
MFLLFLLEGRGWMEWLVALRCLSRACCFCVLLLCVVVVVVVSLPICTSTSSIMHFMFRFSSALLLSY